MNATPAYSPRRRRVPAAWLLAALIAAVPALSRAQTITAWTCDAGIARVTNATTRLHTAAGQGQPLDAVRAASGTTVLPGFLAGALLASGLDHDADGIPDETDLDNDNDGLADLEELYGTAFASGTTTDVNCADCDGDGVNDGAEAGMHSNPWDAGSRLLLTAARCNTNQVTLCWRAQGGQRYSVLAGTNLLAAGPTNVVSGPVTASGGAAPWFDTVLTNSFSPPAGTPRFYRVRLNP